LKNDEFCTENYKKYHNNKKYRNAKNEKALSALKYKFFLPADSEFPKIKVSTCRSSSQKILSSKFLQVSNSKITL